MVTYIIHFELQKNKAGIALGFLSIDLIQKKSVNCNYSSWKINYGAISYLMNFWPKFTCLAVEGFNTKWKSENKGRLKAKTEGELKKKWGWSKKLF